MLTHPPEDQVYVLKSLPTCYIWYAFSCSFQIHSVNCSLCLKVWSGMFPNFLSSLFPRLCPGDSLLRSSPLTMLLTSPCMSFLHVQWAVLQGWGIPFSLYTLTSGTTMTGSVICLELYWGHLVCCFWFCGKWFESLLANTRVPELRVREGSLRERKWKRKHILETSSQEITRRGGHPSPKWQPPG